MEGPELIKILILTSSRADFGIYQPLLKSLKNDARVDLKILAFGTHLSKFHGYTKNEILNASYKVDYEISSMLANDQPEDIATAYGLTAVKFGDFWNNNETKFNWVVVLGDRYEMAAAVAAGIPYNLPFAHIHAGETTLGSIDNIYRHSISLGSKLHFVSLKKNKERVDQLFGSERKSNCYVTGALSLDNMTDIDILTREEFKEKWSMDLSRPSVLVTIHPETVAYKKNRDYAQEAYQALMEIGQNFQVIVTMPNADTSGSVFREVFQKLQDNLSGTVFLIENFGVSAYFTCMSHCGLLIGNTSSGIIEAASFKKYVLNLGNRQKGRVSGPNVIHVPFDRHNIIKQVGNYFGKQYNGENIYYLGGAAESIKAKLIEYAAI